MNRIAGGTKFVPTRQQKLDDHGRLNFNSTVRSLFLCGDCFRVAQFPK